MILPIYLYGSQVLRAVAQEDDLSDREAAAWPPRKWACPSASWWSTETT